MNSQTLDNFLLQLQMGYGKHSNPYHNQLHAADVTQTAHHVITRSGLSQTWMTDVEIFATLLAAMIHDFEHTGTTNSFHINTNSDMALIYNDRAVLESHHASAAFRMMRQEDCNILASMKKEDYKELRALVIEIVLATDMSFHFSQIKTMKSLLSLPDSIDKCKALSLIVHCSDISHPAKSWELHSHWTELVVEEFFKQGDRESNLSLAISPLCDRKSTLVAESQIGFIDFIVDPSFQVMAEAVDKILNPLNEQTPKIGSKTSAELVDTSILPSNKFKIVRHWNDCLINNKQKWKEKSIEEKSARAAEEEKSKEQTEPAETRIVSTPIATVMNVKEASQTTSPPVEEVRDFPDSVTLDDTKIEQTRRSSSIGDNDSFHSSLDSLLNSD